MADLVDLITRYRGYVTAEGNGSSLSEDEMFALLDCAEVLQDAYDYGYDRAKAEAALSRLASVAKEE